MKNSMLIAMMFTTVVCAEMGAQTTPTTSVYPVSAMETITVVGTGKVKTTPDRVSFTAGVETTSPRVDDAVRDNNAKTAQVISALKTAGARPEEIRTSNFSIYPQYDYQEGRRPRILGYQVTNSVTVTREKIEDAGRILQAAVNAGVNQASGLTFSVSDPARGRDDGLRRAFVDARAKAQTLAEAAGRRVGRAVAIWEGSQMQPYPPPMPNRGMMMESKVSQDVPVEAGQEEMTFTINVTFNLM